MEAVITNSVSGVVKRVVISEVTKVEVGDLISVFGDGLLVTWIC